MNIQVVLVIILSLLAISLIVVGVYVVFVLRDFRQILQKVDSILGNVENVSELLSNPLSIFGGLLSSVIGGFNAVKKVKSIKSLADDE